MNIELKEITIRDLYENYEDNGHEGVVAYGGRLDVRPKYQREFVYKEKQREAVIDTVIKRFPLNVMYWAVKGDGNFEIIDGQQRTISICQFLESDFSLVIPGSNYSEPLYSHNLQESELQEILDYKLTVYQCSGGDKEKLEWFKTINIAGEKLTDQELRNAVYSGSWVSDAKRYFSRNGCVAQSLGGNYLSGSAIRQDYLETAIAWISEGKIEKYMGQNQHRGDGDDIEKPAEPLWDYFKDVINWVQKVFPEYRKEMKGLDWGALYNEYSEGADDLDAEAATLGEQPDAGKDKNESTKTPKKYGAAELSPAELSVQVAELMEDEEVTSKRGIYPYCLTRDEKHLNLRTFSMKQKREAFEKCKGICANTKCPEKKDGKEPKDFMLEEMEADHITPWSEGGRTELSNCQMLCKRCNRTKSNK